MMISYIVRFASVGAASTCVGLLAIYFAMAVLDFGEIAANMFGYLVGFILSYLLNRNWTFSYRGAVLGSLARFLLVNVSAYVANLAVLLFLYRVVGLNVYLAQLAGMATYSTLGFIGNYYFAFREKTVQ